MAAFYDEPPLPAQLSDNKADWPAGALLPDIGVMRKWTWRTLQAAKDELSAAVESVMEDLEGLGASSCNSSTVQRSDAGSSSGSCYNSSTEGGTDDDEEEEEEGTRVNDLVPPVTRRAEYEMDWTETEKPPHIDSGFEVINWADEISGQRGPSNVIMME